MHSHGWHLRCIHQEKWRTREIVLWKIPKMLQHRFVHLCSHLFFIVLGLRQEIDVLFHYRYAELNQTNPQKISGNVKKKKFHHINCISLFVQVFIMFKLSLHVMYVFILSPVLMWLWDVNKNLLKIFSMYGKFSIFVSCFLLRLEKNRCLKFSVWKKPT